MLNYKYYSYLKRYFFHIIIIIFISFMFGSCDAEPCSYKSVKYEVTGTVSTANIVLADNNGHTQSFPSQVPYSITYNEFSSVVKTIAAISTETGTVTVSIYIDGERVRTSNNIGRTAIATITQNTETCP